MKKFTVTQNCTLRDFTDCVFPQAGFCLTRLLRDRDIKINGARTGSDKPLSAGDEVVYYTTPKEEAMKSHSAIYEDENILIADKFSGVSTEGLCSELNTSGDFYAVHRLDRNTSGLICFAKTAEAVKELLRAFKERLVTKKYLAVCKDGFKKERETLTAYLKKDSARSLVKIYPSPCRGGVKIVTEYAITERREGLALAEITLHTGRTHQIRAHMAFIGCPVLGDEKYGDSALNALYSARRQYLNSFSLKISAGGKLEYLKNMTFESAIPISFPAVKKSPNTP